MAQQVHRPAVKSKGWMSFSVANGAVLELGGATQTAPTSQLSPSNFLTAGIPQDGNKTRFAEIDKDDPSGHAIKHAVIMFVSDGGTSPNGRYACDGSTPTTSLGKQTLTSDVVELWNSRSAIFSFKWFNRSGNTAVVEVEVYE